MMTTPCIATPAAKGAAATTEGKVERKTGGISTTTCQADAQLPLLSPAGEAATERGREACGNALWVGGTDGGTNGARDGIRGGTVSNRVWGGAGSRGGGDGVGEADARHRR